MKTSQNIQETFQENSYKEDKFSFFLINGALIDIFSYDEYQLLEHYDEISHNKNPFFKKLKNIKIFNDLIEKIFQGYEGYEEKVKYINFNKLNNDDFNLLKLFLSFEYFDDLNSFYLNFLDEKLKNFNEKEYQNGNNLNYDKIKRDFSKLMLKKFKEINDYKFSIYDHDKKMKSFLKFFNNLKKENMNEEMKKIYDVFCKNISKILVLLKYFD